MSTILKSSSRTSQMHEATGHMQNSVLSDSPGRKEPTLIGITKPHLPSRYHPPNPSLILSQKTLLTKVEQTLEPAAKRSSPTHRIAKSIEIEESLIHQMKVNASQDLKPQPLRRNEHDFLLFKDIFVKPKETRLQELKSHKAPKITNSRYDPMDPHSEGTVKVIRSYYEETPNLNTIKLPALRRVPSGRQLKGDETLANADMTDKMMSSTLEPSTMEVKASRSSETEGEKTFFDQQIQVQPPDQPNSTLASPLSPGNGWAPSIPPTNEDIVKKPNLKDLLVRAKAGMQAGDIQKEAHLSFYLGIIHEGNDQANEAIKYFKKYFSCAKALEDKIGMALAMNRIGTNYHKLKKYDKSIACHIKHMDMTNMENAYAAYYNLGISYRHTGQYEESLLYFKKALEWARDQNDPNSECLSLGQLGITNCAAGNLGESRQYLEECYALTLKLRNNKLQLDCLSYLTKVRGEQEKNEEADHSRQRYQEAYKCAKSIGDLKYASVCLINMGVMEGNAKYQNFLKNMQSQLVDSAPQ